MFSLIKNRKILVLGAHPDDELGCGGTISKLIDSGCELYHYYFSTCDQSLEKLGLEPETLIDECNESRKILGIDNKNCGSFRFQVRYFPRERQAILEEMVKLNQKIEPDLVFVPNRHDIHQDHQIICNEAIRAFKYRTILGYELPWNTLTFDHDCFVPLDIKHIEKKNRAVNCYKSQLQNHYASIEFLKSLARVRGVQANSEYAECFEVIRIFL